MISQLTNSAPSSIAFFSTLSTSADYERRNYGNEVLGIAIPWKMQKIGAQRL